MTSVAAESRHSQTIAGQISKLRDPAQGPIYGSARIAQGLSSRGVTPDSTKATEHGREKKRQGEIFAQYDPPTSS